MKILSWNCQGLGNPWTIRGLCKLMREQDPKVCFLMKTRLDKGGFKKHCKEVSFQNKLIVKNPNSGGGVALLWKSEVKLEVVNYTKNPILAKVVEEDGFVWHLTGFYGWPEVSQKRKSWALLSHLATLVEGPWCCIGDFNAILLSTEKQSKHPPPYKQMEEFGLALDSCGLCERPRPQPIL